MNAPTDNPRAGITETRGLGVFPFFVVSINYNNRQLCHDCNIKERGIRFSTVSVNTIFTIIEALPMCSWEQEGAGHVIRYNSETEQHKYTLLEFKMLIFGDRNIVVI